jgi:hypothetical protein
VLAGCRVKRHPIDWFPFPEIFVRGRVGGRAQPKPVRDMTKPSCPESYHLSCRCARVWDFSWVSEKAQAAAADLQVWRTRQLNGLIRGAVPYPARSERRVGNKRRLRQVCGARSG